MIALSRRIRIFDLLLSLINDLFSNLRFIFKRKFDLKKLIFIEYILKYAW